MKPQTIRSVVNFIAGFSANQSPLQSGNIKNDVRFIERAATVSEYEQNTSGIDNPDPIVIRKGMEIYDEMLSDDALGTYVEMKRAARLATPWKIVPASDDQADLDVAAFVENAIIQMAGSFKNVLSDILSAIGYGFSATNMVFDYLPAGEYRGRVFVARMKTKPPHNITFKTDKFGNLEKNGIIYHNPNTAQIEAMPTSAFVIYTHRKQFNNIYGRSDCFRCFPWWNSKQQIMRYWDIYLERFAGGFLDITHRAGEGSRADHATFEGFIDQLQNRTGIKHSDVWNIEMKEPRGRGADMFERAIDRRDIAMARAVLVPDLLGFSGKPTGSYALGKKHFDVFMWILDELGNDLSETLGDQLIKPMVDINYPGMTSYPVLSFEPLSDEQKFEIMAKLIEAFDKKAIHDRDNDIENFIRRVCGLSEIEPDDAENGDDNGGDEPGTPKTNTGDSTIPNGNDTPDTGNDSGFVNTAGDSPPSLFVVADAKLRRPLTSFERKVDFQSLISTINSTHEQFVESWTGLIELQKNKIIKWLRDKKIVENKDSAAIGNMKLPRKQEMQKAMKKYLLTGYYSGAYNAQREVLKGNFAAFATLDLNKLPPTEIERFFERKGLVLTPAIKSAARDIIRESYFITGVQTESILAETKQIIFRGLKRADRLWTEKQLARVFDKYLETGELVDGKLSTAHRVETIARTNFNTAINAGRDDKFMDPDVDEFIQAFQWSSVLDDATTPYCESMDQKIFDKAELRIEGFPPAHYNCRSIVVPVVKGETFETSAIPRSAERGVGFMQWRRLSRKYIATLPDNIAVRVECVCCH